MYDYILWWGQLAFLFDWFICQPKYSNILFDRLQLVGARKWCKHSLRTFHCKMLTKLSRPYMQIGEYAEIDFTPIYIVQCSNMINTGEQWHKIPSPYPHKTLISKILNLVSSAKITPLTFSGFLWTWYLELPRWGKSSDVLYSNVWQTSENCLSPYSAHVFQDRPVT